MMTETKCPLHDTNMAWNHLGDPKYFHMYRNIQFTPAGFARFWQVIGYCHGILEYGVEEEKAAALKLLSELHTYLDRLNNYGGDNEEHGQPEYRVVLGDDGCWGSFTIRWYRGVTAEQIHKYREAKGFKTWDEAVKDLSLNDDLKLWSYKGGSGYVYYNFAFHGGLILHKNNGSPLHGSYSTHT